MAGLFATARPVPQRRLPVIAGGAAVLLALPVFLAAGWPVSGWVLGAVLWATAQLLGLLLSRLPVGADNLAASSVQGIGMMFRAVAVMVVVIAVAVSDVSLALSAALVYALGYTLELALSVVSYFGGEPSS
jgi:hypothetical protein